MRRPRTPRRQPPVALVAMWREQAAILRQRCPRCFTGQVFRGLIDMNERCPVCDLEFEREPGYFTGAMFEFGR